MISNNKGKIAIIQILILVIAVVAFAWMVGSSIEVVSAADGDCLPAGSVSECNDDNRGKEKCSLIGNILSVCGEGGWTQTACGTGMTCENCVCVGDEEPETPPEDYDHGSYPSFCLNAY